MPRRKQLQSRSETMRTYFHHHQQSSWWERLVPIVLHDSLPFTFCQRRRARCSTLLAACATSSASLPFTRATAAQRSTRYRRLRGCCRAFNDSRSTGRATFQLTILILPSLVPARGKLALLACWFGWLEENNLGELLIKIPIIILGKTQHRT